MGSEREALLGDIIENARAVELIHNDSGPAVQHTLTIQEQSHERKATPTVLYVMVRIALHLIGKVSEPTFNENHFDHS